MSQFVVGLGEALWDMFPKGKRLGGAPANFAYHAAQFGHEGLVVSAVGAGDSFTGAFIGALLGMYLFRHKTQHRKFTLGVPAILLVQVTLIYFFFR